ncbi:hypothetical protein H0H92_011748, partial [Tricholoma furcatifolium]
GSFANANKKMKQDAHIFVSKNEGYLKVAAEPSPKTRTYVAQGIFHLDGQQPTNAKGERRVAVQLTKGTTTTIGQIVVNQGIYPHVSSKAKSIDTGTEVHVRKGSRKTTAAERLAKVNNIAKNEKKHTEKQTRIANAAEKKRKKAELTGNYRKGKKALVVSDPTATGIVH